MSLSFLSRVLCCCSRTENVYIVIMIVCFLIREEKSSIVVVNLIIDCDYICNLQPLRSNDGRRLDRE